MVNNDIRAVRPKVCSFIHAYKLVILITHCPVSFFFAASKVSTECSNRLYVMERWPGFKFEGTADREVFAANRTDCESRCIAEESFRCRSCSFDRAGSVCRMSRETRAMNPGGYTADANSDYMENLCLSGELYHLFQIIWCGNKWCSNWIIN